MCSAVEEKAELAKLEEERAVATAFDEDEEDGFGGEEQVLVSDVALAKVRRDRME